MRSLIVLTLGALALAAQPAPEISLSANSSREVDLPRGWPLLVRLVVLHWQSSSHAEVPDLRLAPSRMTWADAMRIQVDAGAGAVPWALRLATPPDGAALTLKNRERAELAWRMSPEATAALRPGTYTLTATLEIKDSGGWNGRVASVPVTVHVIDGAVRLPPEQETRRQHLRIQYALLEPTPTKAEQLVDELMRNGARDPLPFATKAEILEARGEIDKAYVYSILALQKAREQHPEAKKQPDWLVELSRRLSARLRAKQ